MSWQQAKLKYVARFEYGDALPQAEDERVGDIKVFGSNGPYSTFSRANTCAPAIVVGRKGSYGKVNWSDEPCFASDTTFFIDRTTTKQDLRWLFYLLQTLDLDQGTNEAAVPGLSREHAYDREVLVPSLAEQRSLAQYLDRQTAKIDTLITAKQHLLELLAEKRRAFIIHTISRGLTLDVPLHNSGIEWMSEVPEHWRIFRIKHLGKVGNGSTPLRDNNAYWQDGTFPWLTSTVVNNDVVDEPTEFVTEIALRECHLPIIQPGSVLVAITGEGKTRGKAALLNYEATINQHMAFISPQTNLILPEFLQLYLVGSYEILRMISEGTGSTKGALTCEQIGEFPIPLPPLDEQQAIISELASMQTTIDSLGKVTIKTIELLQERRTALIAAAVSGKIDLVGAS